ncbi:uncharacterized protein MONBRDRAFT_29491 [Monosiga brevicollis MX1]|uniref:DUF5110 domain-containing protein n=1 Tax=Monosiga brevicollis TaxID=81824 RepID=A9VB88_MONBE|nr:uncharacterized protein MONBRDRAFT_29491 [Monosiga brevicollis MX1]EDQ85195.1 predicted protein [Monosiga brevicollis MX1]|eukprot:XP_001750020.1 hypothetical protein [Monosiga brevicollis MX1]
MAGVRLQQWAGQRLRALLGALLVGSMLLGPVPGQATRVVVSERMELVFWTNSTVQVVVYPTMANGSMPPRPSLVVNATPAASTTTDVIRNDTALLVVQTPRVEVTADKSRAIVNVTDRATREVLAQHTLSFTPVSHVAADVGLYAVHTEVATVASERLYGLGSLQNGLVEYNQVPVELVQFNTEAIVPVLLSSRGFGLYFDHYSWSYWNRPAAHDQVDLQPVSGGGQEGTVVPSSDTLVLHYRVADDFGLSFDGQVLVNNQICDDYAGVHNHPNSASCRVRGLQPGTPVKVTVTATTPVTLYAPTARPINSMDSAAERAFSLFVMVPEQPTVSAKALGSSLFDGLVAQYRTLTGRAPLLGRWAYGFWQCQEHYHTKAELLADAYGYRQRQIPIDNIVQDWHYWNTEGWGPQWDPLAYPDPADMVRQLEALGLQLMVSVWSKFDVGTSFYQELAHAQALLPGNSTYMDPWSRSARDLFYQFTNESMYGIGVAAIWADATEPEGLPNLNNTVALGAGNEFLNTFSLEVMHSLFTGWERDYEGRFFSLTRSAFAGQQRYSGVVWSGDTTSTWTQLYRQMTASMSFALAGMPYWSQDLGGFFRPADQYNSSDYQDLLIRWFQLGLFTPIYRVHGSGSTAEHYTMQRPLAFDFIHDAQALEITDQYMFGPALMVAPVYHAHAEERSVYLPKTAEGNATWFDFFTGQVLSGGQSVTSQVAADTLPVFVPAGRLLVLGNPVTSSREAQVELELRIYPGGDDCFTLYEDDGVSRGYERGVYSTFELCWREEAQLVSFGARVGQFQGFAPSIRLNAVRVRPGQGVGFNGTTAFDASTTYTGDAGELVLPPAIVTA